MTSSEWHVKPPLSKGRPDDFQTPAYALQPLLPHLRKANVRTIWECASGMGLLASGLESEGYQVFKSDILTGVDFLTCVPPDFDCIVTNPPYTLKDQFIARCYQLGKPFALLMPLTTLEGQARQRLFQRYGVELLIMDRRINFVTPSGEGGGSWFMTAWFTYGLDLGSQLIFTNLIPPGQKRLEVVK